MMKRGNLICPVLHP